ncbi:hypothetical protein [Planctomycetes bacterium TBK1r]|uniref:DUF1653 domain-containing protein n=1 Tax=Stieleria magnilauensis TaxID=2527963 RepID=A0ABX5XSJ1_9BACT|nr:hypothetical protein TBK1r_39110 [Planctomycetes bacterium TBK1r]
MMVNELPDAITNPQTPRDQRGDRIDDGNWYRLTQHRTKPVKVLVRLDPDQDILLCQPLGGGLWQRIDQMDPQIRWERLEGDEAPC